LGKAGGFATSGPQFQKRRDQAQTHIGKTNMTVSLLEVGPDDETEVFTTEDGTRVIEAWDWDEVVRWLEHEARACLGNADRELAPEAREWIVRMVESFDVQAILTEDGDRTEPEPRVTKQKDPLVSFTGRISFKGQVSPVTPCRESCLSRSGHPC
jgi:hypothetical protein